jgi:hypothetical protein
MNWVSAVVILVSGGFAQLEATNFQFENANVETSEFVAETFSLKYAKAADMAWLLDDENLDYRDRYGILQQRVCGSSIEYKIKRVGKRKIVVDERTNSLLIIAARSDLEIIKEALTELDVVSAQILIDALILLIPADQLHSGANDIYDDNWRSRIGNLTHLRLHAPQASQVKAEYATIVRGAEFSLVATMKGKLDAATAILSTNAGIKIIQRPRIQTSAGIRATMFSGFAYPSGGVYPRPLLPPNSQSADSAIEMTFEINSDLSFSCDIREVTNSPSAAVNGNLVGSRPLVRIAFSEGESYMLAGPVVTNRASIFSEVSQFDRVPKLGGLINKVITYPKRSIRYETIVLFSARMLPFHNNR